MVIFKLRLSYTGEYTYSNRNVRGWQQYSCGHVTKGVVEMIAGATAGGTGVQGGNKINI